MGNVQFINAGAGSGKTYTLTKKLCELLSDTEKPAKPSEFILTTYTKAAADEFRSKIKTRLISENMLDKVPLVESAMIGTIHSVAQSYVEKYWYLLDVSPRVSIKDDIETDAFRERVLEIVTGKDDPTFFSKYVQEFGHDKSNFWKECVLDIVGKLDSYGLPLTVLEDFKKASKEIIDEVYPYHGIFENVSEDKAKREGLGALMKGYLYGIVGVSAGPAQRLYNDHIKPFVEKPSLKTCTEVYKKIFPDTPSGWVKNIPFDFQDYVSKYIEYKARELALECVDRIFALAGALYNKIEAIKKAEGFLDYNDLEVYFLKLLSFDSVRTDIAASIKYVYVDEFQDVNPIQLEIFRELSCIVEDSCWVGDPKQAIYGFRGSDTALANSVISTVKPAEPLKYSYRSLPQLVNASNNIFINAFGCLCPSQRLEADKVKLEVCEKKDAEEKKIGAGYKGVQHWWLSNPTQKGESKVYSSVKLNAALASKLREIFDNKEYKVTDTDSNDKPYVRDLKYGDVAILADYRVQVKAIADALREKGLPVSVLDDKLDNQVEVRLVLALMKYVAGVNEKHSMAELRSLLKEDGLEEILLDLANNNQCHDLNKTLDALREKYQYYSVYDMVRALIAAMDLRHRVCKWQMGHKRQANLDTLAGLASSFVQNRKDASVLEFINYVNSVELRVPFDNSGDSIKVLTYHKSKGLQWKMVILSSLHRDSLKDVNFVEKDFANLNVINDASGKTVFNLFPPAGGLTGLVAGNVSKSVKAKAIWDDLADKRQAEDLRLLYVGFTRAENYLATLSMGACLNKWLDNTKVVFDANTPRVQIYDKISDSVSTDVVFKALPYDKIQSQADVETKRISPSKCEGSLEGISCKVIDIAGNVDVPRNGVPTDVFGTCIHNYMAVHKWYPSSPEESLKNETNADRILEGYGLSEYLDGATLVKQADALCAYVAQNYGEVDTIMHEVPFTYRKNGQVVSGEIDLYIKTKKGEGLLIDFKNPLLYRKAEDVDLAAKAVKYWPQMQAYRDAIEASKNPVDHILIYYPMLGLVAKFSETK